MNRILRETGCAGACLLLCGSLAGAAEPDDVSRVGGLGRLNNLTFEGQKSFSDRELRRVLSWQLECALAAQPDRPLPELLDWIQKVLRAGYERSGFGDARVTAGLNSASNRLVVQIKEGPRLYCGSIRIEGLKEIGTNGLLESLALELGCSSQTNSPAVSGGQAPGQPPVRAQPDEVSGSTGHFSQSIEKLWSPGNPAQLDPTSWARVEYAVTNAFWNLGRPFAEFTVDFPRCVPEKLPAEALADTNRLSAKEVESLHARAEGRRVDLLVQVAREGPRCTVADLAVRGSPRNTKEDVGRFLQFRPGAVFTAAWRQRQIDALQASGRFVRVSASQEGGETDGRITAVLDLEELPEAPPLSQPLPAEIAALLRARQWILDWTNRNDDMVIRYRQLDAAEKPGEGVEFITSPAGEVLIRSLGSSDHSVPARFPMQFMVRRGLAGMSVQGSAGKFVRTNLTGALEATIEQAVLPESNEKGNRMNMTFGFGFSSLGEGKPPFSLHLRLPAAVFTYLAQKPGFAWKTEQDCVVGSGSNVVMRVERATGRLVSMRGQYRGDDDYPAFMRAAEWSFGFEPGCFKRAQDDWVRTTEHMTNFCDPQHQFGSALAYLVEGVIGGDAFARLLPTNMPPEKIADARTALGKLFNKDFFNCLERVLPEQLAEDEATMAQPVISDSPESLARNPLSLPIALALGRMQDIVPVDSWLDASIKLPLLRLAGHGEYLDPQVNRLLASQKLGPLACLMIGLQLPAGGARQLGILGMVHGDSESFLADARAVTDESALAGQMIAKFASSLARLSDKEIDALAAALGERNSNPFRQLALLLRSGANEPAPRVLEPWLKQLWNDGLKDRVKEGLRKLTRARDQ